MSGLGSQWALMDIASSNPGKRGRRPWHRRFGISGISDEVARVDSNVRRHPGPFRPLPSSLPSSPRVRPGLIMSLRQHTATFLAVYPLTSHLLEPFPGVCMQFFSYPCTNSLCERGCSPWARDFSFTESRIMRIRSRSNSTVVECQGYGSNIVTRYVRCNTG